MSNPESRASGKIRIRVAVDRCVGHARCAALAPEVYQLDDEGYNRTAEKFVGLQLREAALRGQRACPERIITVEDVD